MNSGGVVEVWSWDNRRLETIELRVEPSTMKSHPRLTALVLLTALASLSFAQKVSEIKKGSADFKAIIQGVSPYANANSAHPVRVPGEKLRKSGDWAFLSSSLAFVNPKDKGDGRLIALLKKGRRWTIREITIGSGGLDELAAQWEKKYKLPKGLIGKG